MNITSDKPIITMCTRYYHVDSPTVIKAKALAKGDIKSWIRWTLSRIVHTYTKARYHGDTRRMAVKYTYDLAVPYIAHIFKLITQRIPKCK